MQRGSTRKIQATAELLRLCRVPASPVDLMAQIRKGANVDAVNSRGETPLHLMVGGEYGGRSKIEVLVIAKADQNAFDGEGKTPLIRAIINQSRERVEDLLSLDFDVNFADREGRTPSDYVLERGCPKWLSALIRDRVALIDPKAASMPEARYDSIVAVSEAGNDVRASLIPNTTVAAPSAAARVCEAISRALGLRR